MMPANPPSKRKPHSHFAGYVAERRTGPELPDGRRDFVVIYDGTKTDLDTEDGRWSVVCEAHNTLVCCSSLRAARSIMASGSDEFCDECRAEEGRDR